MTEDSNPQPVWRNAIMPPKFNTRHASALGSSSLALHKEAHTNGPPLPKINGDLWQEVYTHRSVARAKPHDEVGDNLRLAILGGEIMRLIITWCLFEKKPHLSAQEIEKSRDEYLLPGNIDSWVNAYNMKVNVRASSSELLQSLEGDTESRILFSSYVGAVFYQHGLDHCYRWIARLIEPDEEIPSLPGAEPVKIESFSSWPLPPPPPPPSIPAPPLPPSHPEGTDATSSTMSTGDGSPRLTPQALSPQPPPFATPPPYQNTPSPATAFLPIFNQTANQRRVPVDYPAQFVGPPHAGRWQVRCIVNGAVKGEGTAASKQLAKEEAARQAYFAMGWDAKPGSVNYSRSPDHSTPGPSSRPSELEDFDMGDSVSQAGSSSSGRHQSSASQHSARSSGPQSYPGNYPGTAPPAMAYLPMFNQTATQRRLIIDYPAEFSGPAHAGNWLVKCTVNGIVKGQGQGSSKQLAKEEAAKQAWFNMGWGR